MGFFYLYTPYTNIWKKICWGDCGADYRLNEGAGNTEWAGAVAWKVVNT